MAKSPGTFFISPGTNVPCRLARKNRPWLGYGERDSIRGSEAEPPVGSRGKAPSQEVMGLSPPEADDILIITPDCGGNMVGV